MINFNSIGLIPLESFYGSEIKLNGGTGKNARSLSATIENQPTVKKQKKTGEKNKNKPLKKEKNWRKTRINRKKGEKQE